MDFIDKCFNRDRDGAKGGNLQKARNWAFPLNLPEKGRRDPKSTV